MNYANKAIGEYGHPPVPTYKEEDFDKMVQEQKVDVAIVTTIDKFHHQYCVRALELGANAIVEKPMTIDAEKLQAMIDAVKRTGKEIRVAFNYRFSPHNTKMRELVEEGTIGDVTQVHFEWLLDTHHGSDFFRRWHRMKENSGGSLLSKSIHHFDLATFWLGSEPELVYGLGSLSFYGPENAKKRGIKIHERTYGTDNAKTDPYALHLDQSTQLKAMYLDAEKEDGYIRDRSVWSEGITIEDTLGLMVRYKSNAIMTYSPNAYSPHEGFRVCLTGTKGRIEMVVVEDMYVPGNEREAYGIGSDEEDGKANLKYV
jgi:predicted dehydrogenase